MERPGSVLRSERLRDVDSSVLPQADRQCAAVREQVITCHFSAEELYKTALDTSYVVSEQVEMSDFG